MGMRPLLLAGFSAFFSLGVLGQLGGFGQGTTEAAVIADKVYEAAAGKVELVGVCRVSETEVQCWDAAGKPTKSLEEETKKQFAKNSSSISIRYGKKTRIVFLKVTSTGNERNGTTIGDYFESNHGSFYINDDGGSEEGLVRSKLRAAVLMTDPTDKEGQVKTSINEVFPTSESVKLVPDSTLNYNGVTYSFKKFVESPGKVSTFGETPSSRWAIAASTSGKVDRREYLNWTVFDKDGFLIRAVDKDGKPVYVDEDTMMRIQNRGMGGIQGPAIDLLPARFTGGYVEPYQGNEYTFTTNIDPSLIGHARATASKRTPLIIKGIPLDPKK